MRNDESKPDKMQENTRIDRILTPITLRLLEFLAEEKKEKYYSLTDIAKHLNTSVSSISRCYKKMVEIGFLLEKTYPRSHTGRPIKIIELDIKNPIVDMFIRWITAFKTFLLLTEKTESIYKQSNHNVNDL